MGNIGITFEPTVTFGLLFQTLFLGTGLLWFLWRLRNEISMIKIHVNNLQDAHKALTEAFAQLGKILTSVAVQDQRIQSIEKRLDELAHGQGFVERLK